MSAAGGIGQQLQQLFGHAHTQHFNSYSRHIFNKLHGCHTAAAGMHYYSCNQPNCQHLHQQYHSCGNRHCPNCGGLKKEQWIENLTAQLFPTAYYHVVFTLPHELHPLILGNRKAMYDLLFRSASQTLLQFSHDQQYLGASCGITMVLHTWGQDLSFHPHVHCIVSGGGVKNNQWVEPKRKGGNFLFPVKAMQVVYKAIFLSGLRQLLAADALKITGIDVQRLVKKTGFKKWNIYARKPFGNVATVVEYLGRYTHKIAITKHRIVRITAHSVTFTYKDYADNSRTKKMTLSIAEFLRRFELHFLPHGFVKIRYYGFLQNHGKTERLNAVRQEMGLQPMPPKVQIPVAVRMLEQYGTDISLCPVCKKGRLVLLGVYYPSIFTQVKAAAKHRTGGGLRNKASPAGTASP